MVTETEPRFAYSELKNIYSPTFLHKIDTYNYAGNPLSLLVYNHENNLCIFIAVPCHHKVNTW